MFHRISTPLCCALTCVFAGSQAQAITITNRTSQAVTLVSAEVTASGAEGEADYRNISDSTNATTGAFAFADAYTTSVFYESTGDGDDEDDGDVPIPLGVVDPMISDASANLSLNYSDSVTLDGPNTLVIDVNYETNADAMSNGEAFGSAFSGGSLSVSFTLEQAGTFEVQGIALMDPFYNRDFFFRLKPIGGFNNEIFEFDVSDTDYTLTGNLEAGTWIFTFDASQEVYAEGDGALEFQQSTLDAMVTITEVPEPGSLALLGLGGVAFLRRRR